MGRGNVIGDPLVKHPGINAIGFTDSQGVGGRIAQQCALNLKKAQLEMVNLPTAGVDYHVPFGGRKGSSYGSREQGAMRRNSSPRLKPLMSVTKTLLEQTTC